MHKPGMIYQHPSLETVRMVTNDDQDATPKRRIHVTLVPTGKKKLLYVVERMEPMSGVEPLTY